MSSRKDKLVLFLPRRDDPARHEPVSADLLPLELLAIAGGPFAEGYEIVLIDALVHEEPIERVLEACDGALLFASSCILGYQVYDGYRVARAVRERYPSLPILWGGWFPSVRPEPYFEAGIADAVAVGQGELTFLDLVHALESGADLEQVPGLVLERDGELVRTAPRAVVGYERLPAVPWALLDYELYAARQAAAGPHKVRHFMPLGERWPHERPPRGFSFASSFGCPVACTFCCSPLVTGRRWKAIAGDALADEVAALQERFRFDTLRFQDANWGVAEKRVRAFCDGLRSRGVELLWNATMEIESVVASSDETLDGLRDSGCHLLWLGAESASAETQARIKKNLQVEHIPLALERLVSRDIIAGTFWILGFPGETRASMEETLRSAAELKRRFPGVASEVYPFRAIPGTEDYEAARALGWSEPSTFEEWGRCFEWKWNSDHTPLPPQIRRQWRRYAHTSALYDRTVAEGPELLRGALARVAGWRLERQAYGFPVEQKLFDWYVRATGQTTPGARAE